MDGVVWTYPLTGRRRGTTEGSWYDATPVEATGAAHRSSAASAAQRICIAVLTKGEAGAEVKVVYYNCARVRFITT